MFQIIMPVLVFLIGIVAGFADYTVGSGGLISIPFLVFLGLPPQVAIATDRLATVGEIIGASASFWKSGKIRWEYIPIFSFIALLGAYIGAKMLLYIDPKNLQHIIGLILLLVLPLVFFKKDIGVIKTPINNLKKSIGFALYFLTMIYDGFFGTGAGPLATYNDIVFFGFTIIEASATNTLAWFFLSVVSLIIFAQSGIIDYRNGIILFVGMLIGGYLGAHIMIKIGDRRVKWLFIAVVIISAIKLLFF